MSSSLNKIEYLLAKSNLKKLRTINFAYSCFIKSKLYFNQTNLYFVF